MSLLKKLREKYRWITPVLASTLTVIAFFVVFLIGKGYDLLFGESYPFEAYPAFEGLTVGEMGVLFVFLCYIIANAVALTVKYIDRNKPKQT